MRYVSRYHATTAPAPTVRAVTCQLGGTERSVIITYTASNSVVTIATRRPRRDAFCMTPFEHRGQRSPTAMPAVIVPQRAQGWLEPPDHGAGELGGRSTASQVFRADVVLDDGGFERPAQPVPRLELADVVEHHRGREHLRRRVRDPLPGDIGRGAVHRLEDRGRFPDVRSGRASQAAYQARRLVRQDVADQVGCPDNVELCRGDH